MFPPRLIIIGAQKSGTTSLAEALARHPDIGLGQEKEPDFYTRNWDSGIEWYEALYADSTEAWKIDASISYSAGFTNPSSKQKYPVAERIHATVPDAKIIYILRDPVSRAYSSYWHAVRLGLEEKDLEEACDDASPYIRQSKYANQLEPYLKVFARGSILILDFAEFKRNELSVLRQVAAFIGVSETEFASEQANIVRNAGFTHNKIAALGVKLLGSHQRFRAVVRFIGRLIPSFARSRARRLISREIPSLSDELKSKWVELFEPHTQELERITGSDFSHWNRASKN